MAPGLRSRKRLKKQTPSILEQTLPSEPVILANQIPTNDQHRQSTTMLEPNMPVDPVIPTNQNSTTNDQNQQPSMEHNLIDEPIILNSTNDHANATIPPKKVRGPTRGLGLEKMIKGNNKMAIDIPKGKGRPISEVQSAKLSSEIGVISRQFISVPTKWRGMTEDDKNHAMERLKTKFEINLDDEYVQSSVMSIISKMSRNQRHKLHLYYKTFPSDQQARQKLPPRFNLTQENWEALCDLFNDPQYKARCEKNKICRQQVKFSHNQGSKAFVASRYAMRNNNEEPDRMEFFKRTHYLEAKGWAKPEAQAAYEKMQQLLEDSAGEGKEPRTIDSIVDEVLGTSSSYIKWLGYGPKPDNQTTKAAKATITKLTEKLSTTKRKLKQCQSNFDQVRAHMEVMTQAMVRFGIQVPLPQFSDNDSSEPSSPGSPQSLSQEESEEESH